MHNTMEGMYSLGSNAQHQASGAQDRSSDGGHIDPFRCLEPHFLCSALRLQELEADVGCS